MRPTAMPAKKVGRNRSGRYSKKASASIGRHIRRHKKEGMPQRQAVAAAMSEQRRKGRKVPPRPTKSRRRKRA